MNASDIPAPGSPRPGLARAVLRWIPRVLGIGVALYFAMYAWGALGHGMAAFALHASPALVPAVAVAISWRRPLLGSVAFTALAAFYAVWSGRLDWAVWISGPLLLVGTLYFCSWRWRSDAAGM